MQAARPSRSALRVALRRAAHQIYDTRPLVFDDPLAVRILGLEFAEELRRTETRLAKPSSAALRAFLVARNRYAEDCLAKAYAGGVRQYCVLGAGLDTFAYRNGYAGLQTFEVDHPATQAWKRDLLVRSAIAAPDTLTYVAVDFEHEDLAERLEAFGFSLSEPAFFAWLGVVPYLTEAAFRQTLRFLGKRAPGSGVALDYSQPRDALPLIERMGHDSLASRVALSGEPFQLFFRPAEMARNLAEFRTGEDLGAREINARYFTGRSDPLRVHGSAGRIASAWV